MTTTNKTDPLVTDHHVQTADHEKETVKTTMTTLMLTAVEAGAEAGALGYKAVAAEHTVGLLPLAAAAAVTASRYMEEVRDGDVPQQIGFRQQLRGVEGMGRGREEVGVAIEEAEERLPVPRRRVGDFCKGPGWRRAGTGRARTRGQGARATG